VDDSKKLVTKNTVKDTNAAHASNTLTDEESIRKLIDEGGMLEGGQVPMLPTSGSGGANSLVEAVASATGESAEIVKGRKPPKDPKPADQVLLAVN
jgi:hypothetical protein